MILIRWVNLEIVLLTCTYHNTDCDTDHSLVCCKIRLQPCIHTTSVQFPEKVKEFTKSLQDALAAEHQNNSASEKWNYLRECIQKTAFATFGRKVSKNNDWFVAKSSEMTLVIDAKRAALVKYKHSPSEKSLQALRATRSKVQQTTRCRANSSGIQSSLQLPQVTS